MAEVQNLRELIFRGHENQWRDSVNSYGINAIGIDISESLAYVDRAAAGRLGTPPIDDVDETMDIVRSLLADNIRLLKVADRLSSIVDSHRKVMHRIIDHMEDLGPAPDIFEDWLHEASRPA